MPEKTQIESEEKIELESIRSSDRVYESQAKFEDKEPAQKVKHEAIVVR